ncbi:hypothetical protein OIO90_004283 [Microbotryomycetes sp. JL221]|nr:hypothetical protein OIO90_004283 [Microbotryomycetes sp. JL221]
MQPSDVLPAWQFGRHASTSSHGPDTPSFLAINGEKFKQAIGSSARLALVASTDKNDKGSGVSLFHEAGVWAPRETGSAGGHVYITSNILTQDDDSLEIKVCRLCIGDDFGKGIKATLKPSSTAGVLVADGVEYEDLDNVAQDVTMANGATAYGNQVLWCSQGQHERLPKRVRERLSRQGQDRQPGSLMLTSVRHPSMPSRPLLNNFFGREFNALNDIAVHRQSGSIFFTDPDYGVKQGFKNPSQLPNGVWRYVPSTGDLSMVADGINKPNGVVCSPDGKTCYVTDTDFIHGDGSMDPTRPGTIYAFDIVGQDAPQLHNKRVFALVDCGAPDGIKCDEAGNVYTGTFEGVNVYAPSTELIGKILLPRDAQGNQRGCANLVFGPPGVLFILSETTVWSAHIAAVGDLKGVEA